MMVLYSLLSLIALTLHSYYLNTPDYGNDVLIWNWMMMGVTIMIRGRDEKDDHILI